MKKDSATELAAGRRIDDLKTILLWEGEIDNARVREVLGVKSVWASRLLAELSAACADFTYRDTSHSPLRVRLGTQIFHRKVSVDAYLRILAGGHAAAFDVEDCRLDLSVVAPATFAAVASAIKSGTGLRVSYRSMSNPAGASRIIFPHAIVRAPRRWHVRAWCDTRKDFRDFNFGRMSDPALIDEDAPASRNKDKGWNTMVTVNVVAHPSMTPAQQVMIADEYFPGKSSRKLTMRRCQIGYVIQDLNIATVPDLQMPPQFQLCVKNTGQILPLFPKDN